MVLKDRFRSLSYYFLLCDDNLAFTIEFLIRISTALWICAPPTAFLSDSFITALGAKAFPTLLVEAQPIYFSF